MQRCGAILLLVQLLAQGMLPPASVQGDYKSVKWWHHRHHSISGKSNTRHKQRNFQHICVEVSGLLVESKKTLSVTAYH